ncbi:hypothetical protein PoB_005325600 [Plakobranchus ocellatus]|uniref:Uncharacterized protein n=1 Tax=Plakobranchus ocellatus TaxID=259542 RepID=A0AAV4C1W0_9GAST|nr:hypothetical protein PoB_005325600 [Plakobranchus ocellatus]
MGRGQGICFKIRLQGSPPTTESNQGDTLRDTPALCQGPLLGLTQAYSEKTDQPIGQRGSALLSRLRRRKWPRRHVDK